MTRLWVGILSAISLASVANCATITYATPSGTTFAGLPDDLSVTITTAANSITVAFDNKTSNPKADTQAISGLTFVLDQFDSLTPSFANTPQATGTLINIVSNSQAATIDTVDTISTWQVSGVASGATTTLDMNVFTGSSPDDLITGTAPGNVYSNANNSITKHNPFVQEFATFTINMVGVTSNTHVTSATFNVGTTTPQPLTGLVPVPEPGTFLLLSLAAIPFGFCLRKGRR